MILAIDVGNTNIVLGTIENGEIRTILRLHTNLQATSSEYAISLSQLLKFYEVDPKGFEGTILSSVVPPVTEALKGALRQLTGPRHACGRSACRCGRGDEQLWLPGDRDGSRHREYRDRGR